MDIPRTIEQTLSDHQAVSEPDIDTILAVEAETRKKLREKLIGE